jgi:general secretion pathway protein I
MNARQSALGRDARPCASGLRPRQRPSRTGGTPIPTFRLSAFTLLEVLISLAIFALAAVVLGAAYINVLHNYATVSHGTGQDQDVAFARQELMTQPDLQTAENGDEFDTADPTIQNGYQSTAVVRHIKWTAEIDPTNTTDLFTVIFTCQVSTASQPIPATTVQTFMLLRPTWSDPTDRSNLRQAAASRIAQLQGKQP